MERLDIRELDAPALVLADWSYPQIVAALATGGSPHHMLALNYALRPVLQSLSARHRLPGVYAADRQIPKNGNSACAHTLLPDIAQRLNKAIF